MALAVSQIEKAELHCHIDGLLDPAMLDEPRAAGRDLGLAREEIAAALSLRFSGVLVARPLRLSRTISGKGYRSAAPDTRAARCVQSAFASTGAV
jgi:hypothetical protein